MVYLIFCTSIVYGLNCSEESYPSYVVEMYNFLQNKKVLYCIIPEHCPQTKVCKNQKCQKEAAVFVCDINVNFHPKVYAYMFTYM